MSHNASIPHRLISQDVPQAPSQMRATLASIWSPFNGFLEWFGELGLFAWQVARAAVRRPFEGRELLRQLDEIGSKSLPLVALAGAAIGAVLSLESRSSLVRFGAKSMLPAALVFSIIHETGPIVTGLVVSGRVGAGIGAELGSMKVTEQIDAIEASGVNPYKYLAFTRIVACILMLPLLTLAADFFGVLFGWVADTLVDPISLQKFVHQGFAEHELQRLSCANPAHRRLRADHRNDRLLPGNAHERRHRGCGAFRYKFGRPVLALCHSGRRRLGEIDPGVLSMMLPEQAVLVGREESAAPVGAGKSRRSRVRDPRWCCAVCTSPSGSQIVLDGINLTVKSGDTLAVLGRSGTGKSVLLKLIIGLQKPDSGSILVHEQEITRLDLRELNKIRKKMGFLISKRGPLRLS